MIINQSVLSASLGGILSSAWCCVIVQSPEWSTCRPNGIKLEVLGGLPHHLSLHYGHRTVSTLLIQPHTVFYGPFGFRFRKAGYQGIDSICDHYASLQDKPVKSSVKPGYLREALPGRVIVTVSERTANPLCSSHSSDQRREHRRNHQRLPESNCARHHKLATSFLLRVFPGCWYS